MPRPRTHPLISAEKILALQPDDVRLLWGTTIPNSDLRACEVRLAREAAAAAGFDIVVITYVQLVNTSLSLQGQSWPIHAETTVQRKHSWNDQSWHTA